MRVIAGSLKGRRLAAPTWPGVRPTSDKLRETLFNILMAQIPGARVLDGYAGTGALGIEALSRGASHVTFVERDRRAQALIAENLRRCAISEGYAIIRAAFERAVTAVQADPAFTPFDVVLLDPPYDQQPTQILSAAAPTLAPGGVVVYEHARRQAAPDAVDSLVRMRAVPSGDSQLSFYRGSKGSKGSRGSRGSRGSGGSRGSCT